MIIEGAKLIPVATAKLAEECQLEESGMTRLGIVKEALRAALPKGSWKIGPRNMDRLKGSDVQHGPVLWGSGQLTAHRNRHNRRGSSWHAAIEDEPVQVERGEVISDAGVTYVGAGVRPHWTPQRWDRVIIGTRSNFKQKATTLSGAGGRTGGL